MSKLIVFATLAEAQACLELSSATLIENQSYRFAKGIIVISGIGNLAAATAVTRYANQVSEVWNFGIAGSLQQYEIGAISKIQSVSKYVNKPITIDEHSSNFSDKVFPTIQIAEKGMRLVTSDYPVHNLDVKTTLGLSWDLVDMEGYGIAYAAQQANKPCHLYKIVSDFSVLGGQKLIQASLKDLSHKIAHLLQTFGII